MDYSELEKYDQIDTYYNDIKRYFNLIDMIEYDRIESQKYIVRINKELNELSSKYDRLLNAAKKMHLWIFLHTGDEKAVYDELELTDEENALLGYGGQLKIKISGDEDE